MAGQRHIPALTGLRGIAAFWVVLYHIEYGLSIPIIEKGYLGVNVFFMLSGFVLMYVYAHPTAKGFDYICFIKARLARIYSLHFATLCLVAIVVISLPGFAEGYAHPEQRWSASAFLASLLLVQNWGYFLPTCWNAPAWSLSAEWFAYLAFPFFLRATQWPKSIAVPLILAAGSLLVLAIVLMLRGIYEPLIFGPGGMLRLVCEFAAGCFLFRAAINGMQNTPPLVELTALALVLIGAIVPGAAFLSLPGFGLIILAANGTGWIARILATRPLVFLGEISYSVYMVHWIVLQVYKQFATVMGEPKVLRDTILIFLIIGLSNLSYKYIELPARAWGRSVGSQPAPATVRAA